MPRPTLSLVPSHAHKLGLRHQRARRLAAARIRRLRVSLRLTQAEAADLCGVAERSWRDWELGRVRMAPLEALVLLEQWAAEVRRAA